MRAHVLAVMAVGLLALPVLSRGAAKGWDWWPGPTPPEVRDELLKPHEPFLKQAPTAQIEAAAPDKAPAAPAKPRKVLVWGRLWTHPGNATCVEALQIIGKKTGAFEAVGSDDPRLLLPESLKGFDAIFWVGLHTPEPFLPLDWKELPADKQAEDKKLDAAVKASIIQFVMEEGKGIAGVEGSLASLSAWPEYGEMMGSRYGGHYFDNMAIQVEDPANPVAACFGGKPFKVNGQGYIPAPPYSRDKLRVLLSLDLTQMANPAKADWQQQGAARVNNDFPISWIRQYGKGRVFYVSLGVWPKEYTNPAFLAHLLAGTQFAIGDLKADATPSGERKP